MEQAVQITFKQVPSSPAVEKCIFDHAVGLERIHDGIVRCRVVVERPHRHHRHGNLYAVRITLAIPGHEIVVGRDPTADHAHEDVYVAIRDAFEAAERQLRHHVGRDRRQPKHHEAPAEGIVARVSRDSGYGFIETADGREVYFHRNSVADGGFDDVNAGTLVRFAEELGEKGPQATVVHLARPERSAKRRAEARP